MQVQTHTLTKKQILKLAQGIDLLRDYLDNFSTYEGNMEHNSEYKILFKCLWILEREFAK